MAYPSSIKQTITGRPTLGYTNIYEFGDKGGASESRFYVWGGIKVLSVTDGQNNIGRWKINCIYIEEWWNGYPGRIKPDYDGRTHWGGYEVWTNNGSYIGIYWPWRGYDYAWDLSNEPEGDHFLEGHQYSCDPGRTVVIKAGTGSYSGGNYGASFLNDGNGYALKLPSAPICYFHKNDPTKSNGETGKDDEASTSVYYTRTQQWEGLLFPGPGSTPSISLYNFLGWYETPYDEQGVTSEPVQSVLARDVDVHLYARWERAGSSVVYNKNNTNATGTMPDGIKPYGEAYTVENCTYALDDYTFQYWNTSADGTGTTYDPSEGDEIAAAVDTTVTLYAIWKRNHHAPRFKNLPVVIRCNDDNGTPSDEGTRISVTGTAVYDSLYTTDVKIKIEYMNALGAWVVANNKDGDSVTVISGTSQGTIEKEASFSYVSNSSITFSTDSGYKIRITIFDDQQDNNNSKVETFLSSAFFYMDINPGTKVTAFGAGAGQTGATWDNNGSQVIDRSGTVGTVDFHTNTLFSNDVYFHEGSQLLLGGQVGNSGDILVSGGTGAAPVWRAPINVKFDLIYDHTGSWWYSSAIGGGVPGDQYYDNGELIDGYSILDYKFLLLYFKAGNNSNLSNARGSVIVPVSGIYQWHSWDTSINYCVIDEGTNCFDWVYSYPAADPSWFIDVAFGFFNDHHIYAVKRTTTNQNLHTWNLEQIWGIGIEPWGQGSAPLGYTRFTGELSYTPRANQSVNIDTDGTYLDDDITVNQIPYAETDNQDGGITASIASN